MTTVRMFVNGQALSGGSLNDALAGARLIGEVKTAPRYRFYTVRDEFPGLYPVASGGVSVPGEVYEVSYEVLREKLLPREPSELELTVIELDDGSGSLSMKMREESLGLPGVSDISDRGGWIAYGKAIA
ncbi:gamma-glutamylcyclotransferase [Nocardia sp. BMG51109]|uniref:allophanate hydrolase-related protein n=1 Tax=Nocardia sp. BMG51109 TaxID=1056816 RepID=UPI00046745E1|nr:gamma-glutamylcyclotransferase [Nocardia sp. BMG51109]